MIIAAFREKNLIHKTTFYTKKRRIKAWQFDFFVINIWLCRIYSQTIYQMSNLIDLLSGINHTIILKFLFSWDLQQEEKLFILSFRRKAAG